MNQIYNLTHSKKEVESPIYVGLVSTAVGVICLMTYILLGVVF